MTTTAAGDQLPPIQVEWTAGPGDARRATLTGLRMPHIWRRVLIFAAVGATVVAAFCIATGSGWALGLLIGAALFVGYAILGQVLCLLVSYLQNRRVLAVGAKWGAGADDERVRFDTPVSTVLYRREDIATVTDHGGRLVAVTTTSPKQSVIYPAALFVEPVWRRV